MYADEIKTNTSKHKKIDDVDRKHTLSLSCVSLLQMNQMQDKGTITKHKCELQKYDFCSVVLC